MSIPSGTVSYLWQVELRFLPAKKQVSGKSNEAVTLLALNIF